MTRLQSILGDLDPAKARGLEIGPRHAPLLHKPDAAVSYVDYTDTETLRATQHDPGIDPASIVEVDIVWGGAPLVEAAGGPVDYVVASHVVEHVPDLIGWLAELREALVPGGLLGLAAPDKRFTFDRGRPLTSMGDLVAAYLNRFRSPSIRQIFDARAGASGADPAAIWRGEAADPKPTRQDLIEAFELAQSLQTAPRYQDAHCWVFTPQSFLDLIEGMAVLDLFPFTVESLIPTAYGEGEFFVRLRAAQAGEADAIEASIRAARPALKAADQPGSRKPSKPWRGMFSASGAR